MIYQDRLAAFKALHGKFLLKGKPVIVRLHRFRNVGEAVYVVRGKQIKAKDLIDMQVGLEPKEDIRDLMPPSYQNEVFRFLNQEQKYLVMMRAERKKLRKDLKKKKGDELLQKLMKADNEEASSPVPLKQGQSAAHTYGQPKKYPNQAQGYAKSPPSRIKIDYPDF